MDGAAARNLSATQDGPSASEDVTAVEQVDGDGDGLSRREHDILAFERQWWKYAGAKEEAIRELFGMSPTRYYQVLNAMVDRSEALAADPMLVKRLRRLRASRQKARAARRLGFQV
ncbi:DUF3263 domain-containing protein [Nocardia sp. NPDC052112]|uniref:DUF3263 domain-containing protein n=1 Tax=Nocardia sp. NPDC052112 TaxID=3155646 RepID=UPI00343B9216